MGYAWVLFRLESSYRCFVVEEAVSVFIERDVTQPIVVVLKASRQSEVNGN